MAEEDKSEEDATRDFSYRKQREAKGRVQQGSTSSFQSSMASMRGFTGRPVSLPAILFLPATRRRVFLIAPRSSSVF